MSLAPPLDHPLTGSLARRQFQRALLVVLAAVCLGCLVYGIEKYLLQPRRRFVENPVEVMMRALGIAHFLIAFLFLITSARLRSPTAVGRLGACTALGVGLCLLAAHLGGYRQPLVALAFYGFFLFHETRDQAELFIRYGEGPAQTPAAQRFRQALSLAAALVLIFVLASVQLFQGAVLGHVPELAELPAHQLLIGWLGLLALTLLGLVWTAWRGRRAFGSLSHALTLHAPLVHIYGGLLAVLACGSLFGSVGFNLVILVHVASWLVFVPQQLAERPVAAGNLWTWLRHTPAGFLVLHLGLIAVLLALMAVRVYEWQRAGLVSQFLATSSFYYWSVMHIAMSLWK